ncbi:YciI family protein [Marinomonas hwangdonensis]|uniref:YciI family protein n=1 Tax=Marinomonas hwangdonensis TaxID=1053647 RepID=A0A3M8Q8S5_9GAMM|nr:YciI family protein [Marinomonas hwangdonensis]MDP5055958.1 YciI family protein [Marinomonas hwangdonensis]RNF52395.1 YciI family protein [Marinomonas hwangdonensis]
MLYSIIGEDVPNSLNDRLEARPAHLARLEVLHNEGRLVLAGPNPSIDSDNPGNAGFSGSVVVAEFATLEDAQTWADADPYVDAGVYQKVTVKPFKQVFPKI